ncbi:MAG: hypothetical protein KAT46_05335 [Deltaproteobacteria bacterium]|nr:hypothetical protein [Deltaproteobacteria bacterium]
MNCNYAKGKCFTCAKEISGLYNYCDEHITFERYMKGTVRLIAKAVEIPVYLLDTPYAEAVSSHQRAVFAKERAENIERLISVKIVNKGTTIGPTCFQGNSKDLPDEYKI